MNGAEPSAARPVAARGGVAGRLRRDPGLALVVLALALAAALYAPAIDRGVLARDDTWLLRDNWIVRDASWSSLHAIATDLSRPTRAVLGAEYLPVRDVVSMGEAAVWGTWWPGYHLVSLALYLAAIAVWFAALAAFGVDRRVAGLAMLLWAVHPTHAESVAWLAEQKGLLALVLAGACTLGYARYRAGGRARWLMLAAVAAPCAVWSKAPAAFALAALAALEVVLPARRVTWRKSLGALAAVGATGLAAFVPVVVVALRMTVVGGGGRAPAGWLEMALGIHGFYLRLAALAVPDAVSYPIAARGPATLDVVLGAAGLVAALAVTFAPRAWRVRPELRAGAVLWLFGWFPVSRLVLPLRHVLVADRYLAFATLGVALAAAAGLAAIASRRARVALVTVLVLASGVRTLAAQDAWRDDVALWARAVRLAPGDGDAWAHYAEALDAAGDHASAAEAIDLGLQHEAAPRLLLDEALELYDRHDLARAQDLLRRAAEGGEPVAMADLALVLADDHRAADGLPWARRALAAGGEHADLEGDLCRVALAAHARAEARAACTRALQMRPWDPLLAWHLAQTR